MSARAVFLLALVALAMTPGPAAACSRLGIVATVSIDCEPRQAAQEPPVLESRAAAEGALVTMLNEARSAAGVAVLGRDATATEIARAHARRMARRGRIYHNSWLLTAEGARALDGRFLSENVGVGRSSATLHAALMESRGHRRNILDPAAVRVGVGVFRDEGTLWIAQVFLRGLSPVAPEASPSPPPPVVEAPLPAEPAVADEPSAARARRTWWPAALAALATVALHASRRRSVG